MSVKVFVAGDLHIPSRATMLHPKFQEILDKEKWDYIVLTGDFTIPEVLYSFRRFLKKPQNLIACQGNMDQFPLPEKSIFKINNIKMGVFHGTGIYPRGDINQLKIIADEMNVKILFTGHTHQILFYYDDEHIILNPGSSSGASGGSSWDIGIGIFVLEILSTNEVIIRSYQLTEKNNLQLATKKFEL